MSKDRFSMDKKVPQKSPRCEKLSLKFIKKRWLIFFEIFSNNWIVIVFSNNYYDKKKLVKHSERVNIFRKMSSISVYIL